MSWKYKSLIYSVIFTGCSFALVFLFIVWPAYPGMYVALGVCSIFDPGNQPYRVACDGWDAWIANLVGFLLDVALYWLIIFYAGKLKQRSLGLE